MAVSGGARLVVDLLAPLDQFRDTLGGRDRACHNEQHQAHHFEPSGNANTISVEPALQAAPSGNKADTIGPVMEPHPVGVAMYSRPLTEYATADPRWPAPVLKLHSFAPVRASRAKNDPSGSPVNTRSPAVASTDASRTYLYG